MFYLQLLDRKGWGENMKKSGLFVYVAGFEEYL